MDDTGAGTNNITSKETKVTALPKVLNDEQAFRTLKITMKLGKLM